MSPCSARSDTSEDFYENAWPTDWNTELADKRVQQEFIYRSKLPREERAELELECKAIAQEPLLKHEWEIVGHGRTYKPTTEDINRPLRFEVIPKGTDGQLLEQFAKSVTTHTVIHTPKEARTRRMISYGGQQSHEWLTKQFKVMNWNILAEVYATEAQYPYCEKFAISWPFRKHLIIKEIKSINADIVTLQEVQMDHYEEWFEPHLREAGYEGVYQEKKHKNPIFHRGKFCREGCATFYKTNRFRRIDKHVVEFDEVARARISDADSLQRLSKGNIAVALILEDMLIRPDVDSYHQWNMQNPEHHIPIPPIGNNCGGHLLCVVNTHILADPEYTDVKLWQAQLLLNTIENTTDRSMPLLICGDFNSTPNSAVYQLWHDGHVSPHHQDLQRPDICGLMSNPLTFVHALRLMSGYEACNGKEAEYTNYTEDFKGTLDYIWFSPDTLSALAVSQVDSEETVKAETALPSSTRPSDHISLVTTFMFTEPPRGKKDKDISFLQMDQMTRHQMSKHQEYQRLCEDYYGYTAVEEMWTGQNQGGQNQQGGASQNHPHGPPNQNPNQQQQRQMQQGPPNNSSNQQQQQMLEDSKSGAYNDGGGFAGQGGKPWDTVQAEGHGTGGHSTGGKNTMFNEYTPGMPFQPTGAGPMAGLMMNKPSRGDSMQPPMGHDGSMHHQQHQQQQPPQDEPVNITPTADELRRQEELPGPRPLDLSEKGGPPVKGAWAKGGPSFDRPPDPHNQPPQQPPFHPSSSSTAVSKGPDGHHHQGPYNSANEDPMKGKGKSLQHLASLPSPPKIPPPQLPQQQKGGSNSVPTAGPPMTLKHHMGSSMVGKGQIPQEMPPPHLVPPPPSKLPPHLIMPGKGATSSSSSSSHDAGDPMGKGKGTAWANANLPHKSLTGEVSSDPDIMGDNRASSLPPRPEPPFNPHFNAHMHEKGFSSPGMPGGKDQLGYPMQQIGYPPRDFDSGE